MSLKDKIDNNLTLFVLGFLVTGFVAGFGSCKVLSDMGATKQPTTVTSSPPTPWVEIARKAKWVPMNECPAYPVSINITSPGGGSHIGVSTLGDVYTDLVVQTSRPLPPTADVALVVNEENAPNVYVSFPPFRANNQRTLFRVSYFRLSNRPGKGATLNFWALVVDDRSKFGSIYSSIDQVKASASDVTLSPKISLTVD